MAMNACSNAVQQQRPVAFGSKRFKAFAVSKLAAAECCLQQQQQQRMQQRCQYARNLFRIALPWTFVIALMILSLSAALPVAQQIRQKFCGKTLADAMDRACTHGFNGRLLPALVMAVHKRDDNDLQSDERNGLSMSMVPSSSSSSTSSSSSSSAFPNSYTFNPFLATMYANILLKTRRRRDGGVYDECCRKSCSFAELAAYCRQPTLK